jgi:hypothetical protein
MSDTCKKESGNGILETERWRMRNRKKERETTEDKIRAYLYTYIYYTAIHVVMQGPRLNQSMVINKNKKREI